LDGYLRALSGLFVAYARDQLGYKTDLTYNLINGETNRRWNWGDRGRSQASVERDMRELLALNPSLRILIAHGRSDVVTPYGVSRYVVEHLPPIGKPDRVMLKVYGGGHMFYFAPTERSAFTADARAFYDRTVQPPVDD
jgi:carboxypeptidase C (cathepsin A)